MWQTLILVWALTLSVLAPAAETQSPRPQPIHLPIAVAPRVPGALRVLAFTAEPGQGPSQDLVRCTITVRNVGREPLSGQSLPADLVYREGDTVRAMGESLPSDAAWVAVETHDGTPLAYRWGIGDELAPGAERTLVRFVRLVRGGTRALLASVGRGPAEIWDHGALSAPVTLADPGQAEVIKRGNPDRPMISLTFDAGADRGYAARILDILRDEQVPASFGVTGQWAKANPELVRRMLDEGHTLFNHTQTHASWTGRSAGRGLSAGGRYNELKGLETTLESLGLGDVRPYFRPPYDDRDAATLAQIWQWGYTALVDWTIDSRGWVGLGANDILYRCLSQAVPGAIIVMHVGARSQDAFALFALIHALRDRGYQFGTLARVIAPTAPVHPGIG